uniref:Uncharacterized protein n=1 Tax=viral metagenome TaxID=1070528 RepID=A0A6C0I6P6_9ZZZZ
MNIYFILKNIVHVVVDIIDLIYNIFKYILQYNKYHK